MLNLFCFIILITINFSVYSYQKINNFSFSKKKINKKILTKTDNFFNFQISYLKNELSSKNIDKKKINKNLYLQNNNNIQIKLLSDLKTNIKNYSLKVSVKSDNFIKKIFLINLKYIIAFKKNNKSAMKMFTLKELYEQVDFEYNIELKKGKNYLMLMVLDEKQMKVINFFIDFILNKNFKYKIKNND